jgi:hypothetical protein
VAGRNKSIEKSNNLIRIRTRDLPACSIVPQPTMPPRASRLFLIYIKFLFMSLSSYPYFPKDGKSLHFVGHLSNIGVHEI